MEVNLAVNATAEGNLRSHVQLAGNTERYINYITLFPTSS